MLWGCLAPERGARLPTLALLTGRQAMGDERAPSILGACGFAPGRCFGKERLWLVMSSWLSLTLCPRTLSQKDDSFLCYMGTVQSKTLSCAHPFSSCPVPSCQCRAMAPRQGQAVKPRLEGKLGCPSHSLPVSATCTSSAGNSSREKVI